MMKRKGWHRKKRRLRHDWRNQYANTLWNAFVRWREEIYEYSQSYWSCIADMLEEADRNAGLVPATDNEPPKA